MRGSGGSALCWTPALVSEGARTKGSHSGVDLVQAVRTAASTRTKAARVAPHDDVPAARRNAAGLLVFCGAPVRRNARADFTSEGVSVANLRLASWMPSS